MMEKNSRNMLSLSKYSRSNAVNQEWTEMYLDEAHAKGCCPSGATATSSPGPRMRTSSAVSGTIRAASSP